MMDNSDALIVALTIHGCPRTKKNSQRMAINKKTGKPFPVQSKAWKEYSKHSPHQITAGSAYMPICEAVNVKALFFMDTRRIVDIVGLTQGLHDLLVERGILQDDNSRIIVSTDGSRVLYDKANPRTDVAITRCSDAMPFED
jgi:hypothetical protein